MKKKVLLTLAAAAVLGLTACNPSTASSETPSVTTSQPTSQPTTTSVAPAAVTKLEVSAAADSIMVGATTQITATVTAGAGVDTGVTYSSSDATIATVSEAGLVTGVKAGSVTITVTTKGKDASGAAVSKTVDISISADYIKFINSEGEHVVKAVVAGISGNNMLVRDSTGLALVYNKAKKWSADASYDGAVLALGDYIKITETFTKADNYAYGSYNFTAAGATIAKLDKTKAPTFTDTAVAYDAAKLTTWTADHKTAETGRGWVDGTSAVLEKDHVDDPYVSVNVKLYKSGTHVNFAVNDFTGSLSANIADGITDLVAANDQKTYTIKGFLTGVTAGKYTYLFITSVEAYTRAATDVDAGIDTFVTDAPAAGVKVGATANVTVTMKDCPNLADKTITYTSSDEKIAKVAVGDDSLHAVVTAVAAGTATITATSVSGSAKTVDVTVIAPTESTLPVTGDWSSSTPSGWTYISNDPTNYPNPSFYAASNGGGLKFNYATMGVISEKFVASEAAGVKVTLGIPYVSVSSTAGTYAADTEFVSVVGLKEDGTTAVVTGSIKFGDVASVIAANSSKGTGSVSVTLAGADIQIVKVTLTNALVNAAGKKVYIGMASVLIEKAA